MKINIIAVGKKMPKWVELAIHEFLTRFPREYQIKIIEIAPTKRSNSSGGSSARNITLWREEEAVQILKAIPAKSTSIALEVKGELWSTEQLAKELRSIADEGQIINFLIGGPDGLSEDCLKRAKYKLSISRFTFPHALVRVILMEQLYRVYSILTNHPYHRA